MHIDRVITSFLLSATLLSFGCGAGPDQFIGAYTFTRTDTLMLTKPFTSSPTPTTSTGTISIKSGTSTAYSLTMTDSNNTTEPCVLNVDKVSTLTLSIPDMQTCPATDANKDMLSYTITSGTGSSAGTTPGSILTINVSYTVSGSSGILVVDGTGSSVVEATPVVSN